MSVGSTEPKVGTNAGECPPCPYKSASCKHNDCFYAHSITLLQPVVGPGKTDVEDYAILLNILATFPDFTTNYNRMIVEPCIALEGCMAAEQSHMLLQYVNMTCKQHTYIHTYMCTYIHTYLQPLHASFTPCLILNIGPGSVLSSSDLS